MTDPMKQAAEAAHEKKIMALVAEASKAMDWDQVHSSGSEKDKPRPRGDGEGAGSAREEEDQRRPEPS